MIYSFQLMANHPVGISQGKDKIITYIKVVDLLRCKSAYLIEGKFYHIQYFLQKRLTKDFG